MSLQTIDAINSRGRIYEVGGVVRDRLLSGDVVTKDRDYLVTGIPYNELSALLSKCGRVDLVGRSFGVIKFTQFHGEEANTFDISLPRKEISTGSGHRDFEVSFDPELPVEEDLRRRDFTVNAMAVDLASGDLIDPLGGKNDLERRQLRMVSDNSFVEDPLRMVRAVQFAARFDLSIEEVTLSAIGRHAELISSVSQERIAEEIVKLLTRAAKPSIGLRLMQETGLLSHVLPELEICVGVDQPGGYHKYDVFEHTMQIIDCCRPELRLRLAALFHDITKPQHKQIVEKGATFYGHESSGARTACEVLKRLRFSNDLIDEVKVLVERHMFTADVSPKGMRRLVRRVGVPLIYDLLDLRRADVVAQGMGGTTEDVDAFEAVIRAELDRKPPLSVGDLALGGNEIMDMFKLSPGPVVGAILNHLLEAVLDDPSDNTPERLALLAENKYKETIVNSNDGETRNHTI